ncbi:MAG: WYL domain-containing protein [Prevotella sp.]|nr:WYL domain-containing protein [Prevotella sp.]MBO7538558.1 WYL domain-containing protein [Prevotella sp.]
MKPAQIFHQYIWIINTLRAYKRLTFEELNRKWQASEVTDGNALQRSSFNRHRDAILDMFGIIIDCDQKDYKYYISNQEVLNDDSVERWLFSTLTVHGVLADSAAVKERVVLENVPAGEEYLETIIRAIRTDHRLHMGYQKFGTEGYVKTVCPYALKLFHQRWYLLAKNDEDQMRIYALDRMTMMELADETFEMPEDFSPQAYFSEYFGVLTVDTPMAHVVIRAHNFTPNYLRTLPLHHSQRELTSTEHYTDFSFDIRPTADFLGQLLSHGDGIEVLEPADLRQKMKQLIANNLKRY